MESKKEDYSSEFKATIAVKALAQSKENLDQLSDDYDVPVSLILVWTAQLERNASTIYAKTEAPDDVIAQQTAGHQMVDIEIEAEDIRESFTHGVMSDDLNYKKLIFWAVLGILFFGIFVQLLVEMYQNSTQIADERTATQNEYYDSNIQKTDAKKRLSTFGVVNLGDGTYHMPIDSVIKEMAVDGNTPKSAN